MKEKPSPQVPCRLRRGLLSNEREIKVLLPGGIVFTAPVDKTQVSYKGRLGKNQIKEGHVNVRPVEYTPRNTVFIDLPGEDTMLGSRVEVPLDFLKNPDSNATHS